MTLAECIWALCRYAYRQAAMAAEIIIHGLKWAYHVLKDRTSCKRRHEDSDEEDEEEERTTIIDHPSSLCSIDDLPRRFDNYRFTVHLPRDEESKYDFMKRNTPTWRRQTTPFTPSRRSSYTASRAEPEVRRVSRVEETPLPGNRYNTGYYSESPLSQDGIYHQDMSQCGQNEVTTHREKKRRAEEAAELARQLAEAEANRKRLIDRIRPPEKIIQPLSQEWENRLTTYMRLPDQKEIGKSPSGAPITARDLRTVLTHGVWLNDEIINAALEYAVAQANNAPGGSKKKILMHNSFFYSTLAQGGPQRVARWMKRKGYPGTKLFDLKHIIIPVNSDGHWTLLVITPELKTVEYFDSLYDPCEPFLSNIRNFLRHELGEKVYKDEEWTYKKTPCAKQRNGYDCGVFTITNAQCVCRGWDPTCYHEREMNTQRHCIGAEIIHGGPIH